jgi:hypothetical protein
MRFNSALGNHSQNGREQMIFLVAPCLRGEKDFVIELRSWLSSSALTAGAARLRA